MMGTLQNDKIVLHGHESRTYSYTIYVQFITAVHAIYCVLIY